MTGNDVNQTNNKNNGFGDDEVTESTPLLPAAESQTINAAAVEPEPGAFARKLGAIDGFTLLIAVIIGSGIFASPSAIDTNVPSPGVALLIWLVGGILAWTGASTMAELGAAFPGEGGIQFYLRYIYGDLAGFLAAWNWVACVMPATLAILSIVFVETICEAFVPGFDASKAGSWEQKGSAVLVMFTMQAVNCIGTETSTTLGNIFAVVKLGSVSLVVLVGVVVAIIHTAHPDQKGPGGTDWYQQHWFHSRPSVTPDGTIDWTKVPTWDILGHCCAALYAGLWAYSGWDKANYAAGELRNPAKQLPLAINLALPTVIASYVLVNAAYYILLPWNIIGLTDSVAVTAFKSVIGRPAGITIAVLIAAVVAGSLNGNIFVVGRLTVAAAHKGYLPSFFGRLGNPFAHHHKTPEQNVPEESNPEEETRSSAPIAALLLSTVLSMLFIIFGNFRALLTFDGMAEYLFFFLTILAALILRFTEPKLKRPYKPPIVLPFIFAAVSGAVVIRGAIFAPIQTFTLFGILAIGVIGFLWSRLQGSR